jgi:hypothetical protein
VGDAIYQLVFNSFERLASQCQSVAHIELVEIELVLAIVQYIIARAKRLSYEVTHPFAERAIALHDIAGSIHQPNGVVHAFYEQTQICFVDIAGAR